MNWTRRELVDHIMNLEHNNQVLEERFEQQYKNCMQIIRDMDIFNKTYKEKAWWISWDIKIVKGILTRQQEQPFQRQPKKNRKLKS